NILRYISSSTEQQVPLADELHYTKDFLLCMAIRYQGNLAYTLNIPDEMLAIQVPKLCVQLLVENAIKFTSTKRPPYNLDISGFADETHYELSIGDNGPGFSQESLSLLRERIAQINETGLLPSLEINGMGLLNVYIRYRLLHGAHLIFRVENRASGGACITIGEYYDESKI
ncbi:MAG: ATP-binding protein, partial [Ruthenibacterium sp.]